MRIAGSSHNVKVQRFKRVAHPRINACLHLRMPRGELKAPSYRPKARTPAVRQRSALPRSGCLERAGAWGCVGAVPRGPVSSREGTRRLQRPLLTVSYFPCVFPARPLRCCQGAPVGGSAAMMTGAKVLQATLGYFQG